MTITAQPTALAAHEVSVNPMRRTALVAGSCYLLTWLASIPPVAYFLRPVLDQPGFVLGVGSGTDVVWGCLLDVVNALACIATAVVLFPVVKRQSETLALGFVATRLMEAAIVVIGVVSLLATVTLRQDLAGATGAQAATLVTTGQALVAVRDWTLLLGPGLMAALNALLLGSLMYRSRLVPRVIPIMGLVGAPLLIGSVIATLFGFHDQFSPTAGLLVLPIGAWELALGFWLVLKGFKTDSPVLRRAAADPHPAFAETTR